MSLIAMQDICADHRAQPRSSISVEKVAEYTEDMERGDKFPPLITFFDGAKYWLADGFHRFYAAAAAGAKKFECFVKDGTLRDAILFSCSANAAHGLRRSNDDKRRAVAKLLEDTDWQKWSDSEIARHCSVTQPFVGKVRKEIAAFSPITVIGEDRTYQTKHGTVSTMKPGLRLVEPPNGASLAKSLHEVDRHIEAMGEPDAVVAHFPEDQRYLMPLSRLEEMAAWLAELAQAWRANMEGESRERIGA